MRVTKSITVAQTGIGKPDYSKEVSAGRERAGLSLGYNQSLKVFGIVFTDQVAHPSPITYVKPPLAIGATAHLVDISTGVDMPYTFPQGYIFTLVQKDWTANQDLEIWGYWQDQLIMCPGISPSGTNLYFNMIYAYTSAIYDPTGLMAHKMDFQIVNVSAATLEGGFTFAFLTEAVGTPPLPTTKDCQCPFCGHMQNVPVGTIKIVCEKCNKDYIVYDLSKIRQM